MRGEGEAIVLTGEVVNAWREVGEQWKMWSSQIVFTQLKVGKREKDTVMVHIL